MLPVVIFVLIVSVAPETVVEIAPVAKLFFGDVKKLDLKLMPL